LLRSESKKTVQQHITPTFGNPKESSKKHKLPKVDALPQGVTADNNQVIPKKTKVSVKAPPES